MGEPKIQDDITIQLQVQKMIVHDTVRINVAIQAQVDPQKTEAEFRKEIQSTLRSFITGDWKIQNITRQKGNQFESVYVNATVRVSDKEDYQLESRAAKVSRIGFELMNPRSEYELTFDEIQAVNAELRLALIKQALEECNAYNETCYNAGFSKTSYRISSSRFDNGVQAGSNNRKSINAMMIAASPAMAASASSMGGQVFANQYDMEETAESAPDEGSMDIGVTSRFSMTGIFVLRSVHV